MSFSHRLYNLRIPNDVTSRIRKIDCFFIVFPSACSSLKQACTVVSLARLSDSNWKYSFWYFLYFTARFCNGMLFHTLNDSASLPVLDWRSRRKKFFWTACTFRLIWNFRIALITDSFDVISIILLIFSKIIFLDVRFNSANIFNSTIRALQSPNIPLYLISWIRNSCSNVFFLIAIYFWWAISNEKFETITWSNSEKQLPVVLRLSSACKLLLISFQSLRIIWTSLIFPCRYLSNAFPFLKFPL